MFSMTQSAETGYAFTGPSHWKSKRSNSSYLQLHVLLKKKKLQLHIFLSMTAAHSFLLQNAPPDGSIFLQQITQHN